MKGMVRRRWATNDASSSRSRMPSRERKSRGRRRSRYSAVSGGSSRPVSYTHLDVYKRQVRNRATADELMQEVWFAVARHAARYEPRARFTTWLFTIAHNRMVEAMRLQRRQISLDAIGYESPAVHRCV